MKKAIQRPLKPQATQSTTQQPPGKKIIAVTPTSTNQSEAARSSQKQHEQRHIVCQSIALFSGRLESIDRKLHLRCPDGVALRVCGIDPKLATWLFGNLEAISGDCLWLGYPKSIGGKLHIFLKSSNSDSNRFDLQPDQARIAGKILEINETSLSIRVTRNIDAQSFQRLQKSGIIQNSPELQPFVTVCKGQVPGAEVGSFWQFLCKRVGEELVILEFQHVGNVER